MELTFINIVVVVCSIGAAFYAHLLISWMRRSKRSEKYRQLSVLSLPGIPLVLFALGILACSLVGFKWSGLFYGQTPWDFAVSALFLAFGAGMGTAMLVIVFGLLVLGLNILLGIVDLISWMFPKHLGLRGQLNRWLKDTQIIFPLSLTLGFIVAALLLLSVFPESRLCVVAVTSLMGFWLGTQPMIDFFIHSFPNVVILRAKSLCVSS